MYQALSLSGGKDSTAMLLMMLERGEQVDDVIVFDTGMEFPEMYEHIDRLEADTGLTFTRLKMEPSFLNLMLEHEITRGKHAGTCGYGWPGPHSRWCTTYKTKAIDNHLRGHSDLSYCIGIAADERRRCKEGKRYPLIEYGVTELEALKYCRDRGYDWGGLYDQFRRVSCWCCPLGSINDARMLRKYHPELWQRMQDMERLAWNDFRADCSVFDLEARFADEDKELIDEL